MNLDWVFEVVDVWAICDVKMTFVISLFNLDLKMKLIGVGTQLTSTCWPICS